MQSYTIYADGGCAPNPGPGGFAWEVISSDTTLPVKTGGGGAAHTTNNIMELCGARDALKAIEEAGLPPGRIFLKLDSKYVLNGIFEWMPGWKRRGWRLGDGGSVKNVEIWKEIDAALVSLGALGFQPEAKWVKGHSGDPGNERVDARASEFRDAAARGEESGAEADLPATGSAPETSTMGRGGDAGEPLGEFMTILGQIQSHTTDMISEIVEMRTRHTRALSLLEQVRSGGMVDAETASAIDALLRSGKGEDEFDHARARMEGWRLATTKEGIEVQRNDVENVYAEDQAAWYFVISRAVLGSPFHRDALLRIRAGGADPWLDMTRYALSMGIEDLSSAIGVSTT